MGLFCNGYLIIPPIRRERRSSGLLRSE